MILSPSGLIDRTQLSFFPPAPEAPLRNGGEIDLSLGAVDLEELEKSLVTKALELADNNQMAAARLLGLTRSKLRSRLKNLRRSKTDGTLTS
jgi:DNA-binding NtrC family response regulator